MKTAAILIVVVGGLSLHAVSQSEPHTGSSTAYCPTGKVWVYTAKGRYCADPANISVPPPALAPDPGRICPATGCAGPPFSSDRSLSEPQTKIEESGLSSLPNIADLERAAASLRLTVVKCEADARAYSDSPSAGLISSISDARVHELNTEAFACMKLGGRAGVRYGYLLKTVVDAAYTAHSLMTTQQGLQNDKLAFAQAADKDIHRLLDRSNDVVGKYNDLVARYNSLLSSSQAVEQYAEQLRSNNSQLLAVASAALGEASVSRYSQPETVTMPSTVYVRQSPLYCSSTIQPTVFGQTFMYTHCY